MTEKQIKEMEESNPWGQSGDGFRDVWNEGYKCAIEMAEKSLVCCCEFFVRQGMLMNNKAMSDVALKALKQWRGQE